MQTRRWREADSNPRSRLGVAVIEAITNDALVSILELLSDTIPFECAKEIPWCCFRGLSTTPIKRLLTRGSFRKKRDYLLNRIERAGGNPLEDTSIKEINKLVSHRNQIVHMNFLNNTNRYRPVLIANQTLSLAKMARDCAHDYFAFITEEFSEMRLQIRTLRPLWYLDNAENYLPSSSSTSLRQARRR